jgi:hypothetical protein
MHVRSWVITNIEDEMTLRISVTGPADRLERLQNELIENEHVQSLKRV